MGGDSKLKQMYTYVEQRLNDKMDPSDTAEKTRWYVLHVFLTYPPVSDIGGIFWYMPDLTNMVS